MLHATAEQTTRNDRNIGCKSRRNVRVVPDGCRSLPRTCVHVLCKGGTDQGALSLAGRCATVWFDEGYDQSGISEADAGFNPAGPGGQDSRGRARSRPTYDRRGRGHILYRESSTILST